MSRAVVFVFVACCALTALTSAKDIAAATVAPAQEFSPSVHPPPTTEKTTTTTTTEKTTTTTEKTTTTTAKTTTTTAKTTTTTPKTTTTTPKTTTTTPKTTTTTPKTTTTTPKTTTTTPKTTTTTPKTTTTTPKTTTTTPKTTTTTAAPPSPPEPTPSTNLTVGNYSLKSDKNATCLLAHMAMQIRVARPKLNGTFIVQPKSTKAVGGCTGDKANFTLQFNEGYVTFLFIKSVANNSVYVNSLSFNISYAFSKGALDQYHAKNQSVHLFASKVGHSYSCSSESIYMGDGLFLDVTKDQMQAFNLTKANEFGVPDHCAVDQPDYRVAIGVGVALLVLIVIVVVAYILSRRKRTDGYQSL